MLPGVAVILFSLALFRQPSGLFQRTYDAGVVVGRENRVSGLAQQFAHIPVVRACHHFPEQES